MEATRAFCSRKGRAAKALAELDRAVELSPGDASLYALRGDAAREVGSREEAKSRPTRKRSQLDPAQPRALSGFVALLIDLDDFARAEEVITQMDDAKVRDLRADEQRVRFLVRTGAGQSGCQHDAQRRQPAQSNVRASARRCTGLPPGGGLRTCRQLLSTGQDANGADARLAETALALAQIYGRRTLGAEKSLERATRGGRRRGKSLEGEPAGRGLGAHRQSAARARRRKTRPGGPLRGGGRIQIMPDDADVHLLPRRYRRRPRALAGGAPPKGRQRRDSHAGCSGSARCLARPHRRRLRDGGPLLEGQSKRQARKSRTRPEPPVQVAARA